MKTSSVSFGNVVAVSGKVKNVKKFNSLIRNQKAYREGLIMQKDVTSHYTNASRSGLMAQSAQRGEPVEIFITGEDLKNVKNNENGWDSLDGILSQLTAFFRVDINPERAVEKIIYG